MNNETITINTNPQSDEFYIDTSDAMTSTRSIRHAAKVLANLKSGSRIQYVITETKHSKFNPKTGKMEYALGHPKYNGGNLLENLRPVEWQYHATKGWRRYRV